MSNNYRSRHPQKKVGTQSAERELNNRGKVLTYRTVWTGHVEYMLRNNTPVFAGEHHGKLGVFARIGLRGGPVWIFFPGNATELLRVLNTGKKIFGVAHLIEEKVRLVNSEELSEKLMVVFMLDMERQRPKFKLAILSDKEHVREHKNPVKRIDVSGTYGTVEIRDLSSPS